MANREFAVLLSAASSAVYGDELVCPTRFGSITSASVAGYQVRRATGLEFEVMERTPEGWRSSKGETALQVIQRRWA